MLLCLSPEASVTIPRSAGDLDCFINTLSKPQSHGLHPPYENPLGYLHY